MSGDGRPTIVILDSSVAVTGALRCAQRMAKLLAGSARFVLVLPRDARIADEELACFDAVERVPMVPLRKSVASLLAYGPALLLSGQRLRALLRRHDATTLIVNDVFHLQGWVARRLGWTGRTVTWVRFDPRRFPGPLASLLLKGARQSSDCIIAVSRFIAGRLPAELHATLLYDCLDPDLAAIEAPAPNASTIVCVGNYIPGKGQDQLIEAFAAIAERFPDARLRFHGGDMGLPKNRAFRARLELRARSLGLGQRIGFHAFAKDLPSALHGAAFAVNLSESESFSLSCLEAQQLGLPVVAFRSGGPEEIIVDGETGYLLPLGDLQAVAAAMFRLLEDQDLRRTMGLAATERVERVFGTETFVRALCPLLLPAGA